MPKHDEIFVMRLNGMAMDSLADGDGVGVGVGCWLLAVV